MGGGGEVGVGSIPKGGRLWSRRARSWAQRPPTQAVVQLSPDPREPGPLAPAALCWVHPNLRPALRPLPRAWGLRVPPMRGSYKTPVPMAEAAGRPREAMGQLQHWERGHGGREGAEEGARGGRV